MEHFDEKTDPKVLLEKIRELQTQLHEERKACNHLTSENKQLKETLQLANKFAEEDEERKVNSLIKYVDKLKKEKEDIIQQVEKEEEFITNTLQKKLTQLRNEKVDLENQLEREQEYIVHKLQKQLDGVQKEKSDLETQIESLRSQLFNLRNDNFVLNQKIAKEEEKLTHVNSEKAQLELNLEVGSERHFNEVLHKNKVIKPKRVRSISVPNSAVYAQRQQSSRKLSVSRQCIKEGYLKYDGKERLYAQLVDTNELQMYSSEEIAKFQQEQPIVTINLDTVTNIEIIPGKLLIETTISKTTEKHYLVFESNEILEEWKAILCDLKPK